VTVIAAPPSPVQSPEPAGQVLLRGISWEGYEKLLNDLGDTHIHLTYDDGLLEIEVPSTRHEDLSRLAGGLVDVLLDTAGLDYRPLGGTTWKRKVLRKGIEADECYYIQSVAKIAGKADIDLTVDPPPDLAIEVEVSSSAIDKLGVYAALRVPEVWRIRDDASVRFLRRNAGGGYDQVSESVAVPRANPALIEAQLKLIPPIGSLIYSAVVRQFRASLAGAPPAT
jgi:Uma2 family endonuclease